MHPSATFHSMVSSDKPRPYTEFFDYKIRFDKEFFERSVRNQLSDCWKEMEIVKDEDETKITAIFIDADLEPDIKYWTEHEFYSDKVYSVSLLL